MSEKIQKLIALIAGLDPADPAHFTQGGKPCAPVLAEKLGESVTAAERDEAWAAYQSQNPPSEQSTPAQAATKSKPDTGMVTCEDVIRNLRKQGKRI